jgi:Holliday junction DNA helicase RuvB
MTDYEGDQFRVKTFDSYIGQEKLKARLQIHVDAAVKEHRELPHVLLCSPPGYGKSSLAAIIADQLGDPFESYTMPLKPKVLASILRQSPGGVLMLDEIHRASVSEQESLLTLLEGGYYQLADGRRIYAPGLTIIAATTEPEKIIPPLFDRFPIKPKWEDYEDVDMAQIVGGMAGKIGIEFEELPLHALGKATGGVPRNAKAIVLAARDLIDTANTANVETILDLAGLDPDGLSTNHLDYLYALHGLGGQAGMATLSSMLQLHVSILKELERLLVKKGLLQFSSSGRELTIAGFAKASDNQPKPRHRRVVA